MFNHHSHDEWSLAWWVITHMSDHSYDEWSLAWRSSLEWWVTRMTRVARMTCVIHMSVTRSLAWRVITRITSDHSHDEWSLAWWSSLEWRVTRMMSHLNDECHSHDVSLEWRVALAWWVIICLMQNHVSSSVQNDNICYGHANTFKKYGKSPFHLKM